MNKFVRLCCYKIKRYYNLVRTVNILYTIFWNFKLFPLKIAKKLPLYIGYNVNFIGAKRGNIKLYSEDIKKGMVELGITRYPQFPTKGQHTMIRISGESTISFGPNVKIATGCSIIATYNGKIDIGKGVFINQGVMLYSNCSVVIGNFVSIGWYSQIYDSSIHCMIDINTGIIINPAKPIFIGDNVWIANHVTIAAGAMIPQFTTVSAHSLVNKDFSDKDMGGLLIGIPAIFKEYNKVRLLNEEIESIIKSEYFSYKKENSVNIQDLGYSVHPFNGEKNILFR